MTEQQIEQYIINNLKQNKTLSEISEEIFNTSTTAKINNFINKHKIKVYKYSDAYLYMDKEWLRDKIEKFGTPNNICKEYNLPRTSVTRYAERFGLYNKKFTRNAKNHINENYFKKIDTRKKAYWLGFFMADSCMYKYKNEDKLQFELKIQRKDRELLEELAKDIDFSLDKIFDIDRYRNETLTHGSFIRTYNKAFCNNLIKHGIIERRSPIKHIPKTIKKHLIGDFIRGLWDGDGTITTSHISISTISKRLIDDLSKVFNSFNIKHYINESITSGGYILYRFSISTKNYKDFKEIFYYDGCFGLKRKINALNREVNKRST